MSLLPPQAIDEFQALWKKHYGVYLSREEATARAYQIFGLTRLMVKPDRAVKTRPGYKQADRREQATDPTQPPATPP